MNIIEKLSQEFNIKVEHVEKTVELIDEGNTIPFIARYRKEVTGLIPDTNPSHNHSNPKSPLHNCYNPQFPVTSASILQN